MLTAVSKYNINNIGVLMTVEDVAALLNISECAVYEHKDSLGGFYPANIRVLRFRPEVIYGVMEGQSPQGLAIRVPAQGETVRRGRPRKQKGGNGGPGEAQGGDKPGAGLSADHHGLFRYCQTLP